MDDIYNDVGHLDRNKHFHSNQARKATHAIRDPGRNMYTKIRQAAMT